MRPIMLTALMLAFTTATLPAYSEENMQQETITRPADDSAENGAVSDMNDDAADEPTTRETSAPMNDGEQPLPATAEDAADNGSVSDMNADAADESVSQD